MTRLIEFKSIIATTYQGDHRICAYHSAELVSVGARHYKTVRQWNSSGKHVHCIRSCRQPIVLTVVDKFVKFHKRIPAVVVAGVESITLCNVGTLYRQCIWNTWVCYDIFDFVGFCRIQTDNPWFQLIVGSSSIRFKHIVVVGIYSRTNSTSNVTLCFLETGFLNQLIQCGA